MTFGLLPFKHRRLHLVGGWGGFRAPSSFESSMVFELLRALPVDILQQCVLLPFCCPRDLACVLGTTRRLRVLRRSCVMHLLEALFQGAGAVNGVSWVLRHGNNRLDDIGLIDWLYCIRDRAAARAYRASLGKSHTVVVSPGGRALASGRGRYGVLGASGNMNSFLFTEIDLRWGRFPGRIPVTAVACGDEHTLLLTAAGTVHSCGHGEYGRLGHGDERNLSRATLVESLLDERIIQVAAGVAHSVAVSWKGEAFTWGWGFGDLLGHGDEDDRLEPTRVSLPEDALAGEATVAPREEEEEEEDEEDEEDEEEKKEDAGAVLRDFPQSERAASGNRMRNNREAITEIGVTPGCVDRVTCAAAGERCTVLGTRAGRVLVSAKRAEEELRGFYEYGRLPPDGRQQCRWVGQPQVYALDVPVVLVVDSPGGQIHAFAEGMPHLNPAIVGQARKLRQTGPDVGASLASPAPQSPQTPTRTPHTSPLEGPAKVATLDGGRGRLPNLSPPSPARPPLQSPRQSPRRPPATKKIFSTVTVSLGERRGGDLTGELFVLALDGQAGWSGNWDAFMAVSTEGALLTAEVLGTDSFRERRDDGVVCALTWTGCTLGDSRSLLVVDDGRCLMTGGHGRTGHLGHGGPAYEPALRVVESALVLGRTIAGSGGLRCPSAQVFIHGSGRGCSTRSPTAEGSAREDTGREDRGGGGGGLLAIVDAAADARDFEDASAEEAQ